MMLRSVVFLVILVLQSLLVLGENHNDFGDKYEWSKNLKTALAEGKEFNIPIMLIIHKSWCGACKSLKPKFAESKEILKLSPYFVMVNVKDDDEPKDKQYAPDGSYIPRILFLSPEGEVMTEHFNELGSEKYKYFYSQTDEIVVTMKKVLKKHVLKKKDAEGEL